MKLTEQNKLGEGPKGEVYRIMTKDKKREYAAKIFKFPVKTRSLNLEIDR